MTEQVAVERVSILFCVKGEKGLKAVLNSYGPVTEKSIDERDPRVGVYKPTLCFDWRVDSSPEQLHECFRRELGGEIFPDLLPLVDQIFLKIKEPPFTSKLAYTIRSEIVSKFWSPIWSGGFRLFSFGELEKVVEVAPGAERAPTRRSLIPMTGECRKLLEVVLKQN